MAELSADEAQRLARLFLTGRADSAEVSRVASALPEDQTLALELLAQMQSALDDVAPSALSADQDRSVDSRIEALITPRIKKRGLFGWLKKLFGRKPKPAAEEAPSRRRRGGAPAPAPAPEAALPPPSAPAGADDGMEDLMPGAAPAAAPAPSDSAPAAAETAATPKPKAKAGGPSLKERLQEHAFKLVVIGVLLLLGLGWKYLKFSASQWLAAKLHPVAVAAPAPTQAPTPVATPAPTAVPTPAGQPRRGRVIAGSADEPLPSQLPPTTPQAAGSLEPVNP